MVLNIGESIFAFGVFVVVGLTENYWLLFFLVPPLVLWKTTKDKENNERIRETHELQMEKLKEEIRLLKVRKK